MPIQDPRIDGGKGFDWGRASDAYAKYRDIYPAAFYQRILDEGLCAAGQRVLDLGTGTGVIPRHLASYGASFVGVDVSPEQIEAAKRLSEAQGLPVEYRVMAAEDLDFPADSFDTITACQCFFYFDAPTVIPKLAACLRPGGRLALLYMAWLPFEDAIAGKSEELVLRYNPGWTGAGETRGPIAVPACAADWFDTVSSAVFDLDVPFTRESWHGRMLACRGVGASLSPQEIERWEEEHQAMLRGQPEQFTVKHYAAMAVLRVKK